MTKRIPLREFQEDLAAKLASAQRGETPRALLGVESGGSCWLLDLGDAGEVVPLPRLAAVPATQPWFAGIAAVRGQLFNVVDFAAFRAACYGGDAPAPRDAATRLLLIGARHGSDSALLVERTLGLKSLDTMSLAAPAPTQGPSWVGTTHRDEGGRDWRHLDIATLLADPAFLNVVIDHPPGRMTW